jgi:hypothetical protein
MESEWQYAAGRQVRLRVRLFPAGDADPLATGGYTTLACLTDSKVFSAGISLYGVADLKLLADDTHKVRANLFINFD